MTKPRMPGELCLPSLGSLTTRGSRHPHQQRREALALLALCASVAPAPRPPGASPESCPRLEQQGGFGEARGDEELGQARSSFPQGHGAPTSLGPSQLHPCSTLRPRVKAADTRIALEKQFYYETKNEMQCLPWHTTKHLKQITSRRIMSQIENTSYKIRHKKTKQNKTE